MSIRILYDGDCPFCTRYVGLLRLREAVGPVELVDLRQDQVARAELAAVGIDPDLGMVVEMNGQRYHGADAVSVLSTMSTSIGVLNRLFAIILSNKLASRLIYPVLRAGRNATLMLLNRQPIGKRDRGEEALFTLVNRFFGLFAILHVVNYFFKYAGLQGNITTLPLLLIALFVLFKPASHAGFAGLVLVMAVDTWIEAPLFSNHTIMKNFLLSAIMLAGLWHWMRGSSWDRFFADFRPVGRSLLLIMYVFGIFHKINTDFLNPDVSCAVALWNWMPPPIKWLDHPLILQATIYGTYAIEGITLLMLLVARLRNIGIVIGVCFHAMLTLSGYGLYPAYSTLSIMLHMMFLSPQTALAITESAGYKKIEGYLSRPSVCLVVLLSLLLVAYFALTKSYSKAGLVWLILVVWPLGIILREAVMRPEPAGSGAGLYSRLWGLNVITLAFFLNGASPYFGLKTAQAINMFSNLEVEGGVSNHLVLRDAPGPFLYLEDLVILQAISGSPRLETLARNNDTALVYYSFLDLLEKSPGARVSYVRNGVFYENQLAEDILARDGHILHPAWVRKFFHFRPVDLIQPRPCDRY